jgi:transposase
MTTDAAVNEVRCTAAIQRALAGKGLAPSEHLVDTAYVDAGLLVRSREELGIALVGPSRSDASWQAKAGGGYGIGRFEIDWERERVPLPAGQAVLGLEPAGRAVRPLVRPRPVPQGRLRPLPGAGLVHAGQAPGPVPEAAAAGRARGAQGGARAARDEEGGASYARRAGIEGTISQGVRAFGLRRSRYRGLARTHLQHVATAAAIDLGRLAAWFRAVPRAATRTSRFAALLPPEPFANSICSQTGQ